MAKSSILRWGTALSVITLAGTAVSDDVYRRTFTGHVCVQSQLPADASIRYHYGWAENDSTSEATFYCPVVAEHENLSEGGDNREEVYVQVYAYEPTSEESDCQLRWFYPGDNKTSYGYDNMSRSISNNHVQFQTYRTPSNTNLRDHYYARCRVPGKSGSLRSAITGLKIAETEDH